MPAAGVLEALMSVPVVLHIGQSPAVEYTTLLLYFSRLARVALFRRTPILTWSRWCDESLTLKFQLSAREIQADCKAYLNRRHRVSGGLHSAD